MDRVGESAIGFERDFFCLCNVSPSVTVSRPTLHGMTEEEEIKHLIRVTQQVFPICKDLFGGLTLEELSQSIKCLSLFMSHSTVVDHINGKNVMYICELKHA